MKKLIYLLIAIIAVATASFAKAEKQNIMELPQFERAVLIIKHYETLHKPSDGAIGYGHVIQPGEPYRLRQLSEKEADALLRKDLSILCLIYKEYGRFQLLLATLAYNIGPAKVNSSTLLKKIRAGHSNLREHYTKFCRYKGRFHKMLFERRNMEYVVLMSH